MEINGLDKAGERPRVSVGRLVIALLSASAFATVLSLLTVITVALVEEALGYGRLWGVAILVIGWIVVVGPGLAILSILVGFPVMFCLIKARRSTAVPVAIAGAGSALILIWHFQINRPNCMDSRLPGLVLENMTCLDGYVTTKGWIEFVYDCFIFMPVGAASALVCIAIYKWLEDF